MLVHHNYTIEDLVIIRSSLQNYEKQLLDNGSTKNRCKDLIEDIKADINYVQQKG